MDLESLFFFWLMDIGCEDVLLFIYRDKCAD